MVTSVAYKNGSSVGTMAYTDYEIASSTIVGDGPGIAFEYSYNPCSPMLSVPQQILTFNSQWRACSDGIDAFYDPPFALTSMAGLEVPHWTSDLGNETPLTTSAQAGPSPIPVTVTPTSRHSSVTSTALGVNPGTPLESTLPSSKGYTPSAPAATNANQDPPQATNTPLPSPHSSVVSGPAVITNANSQSPQATPANASLTSNSPTPSPNPTNSHSGDGYFPTASVASSQGSDGVAAPPTRPSAFIVKGQTLADNATPVALQGTRIVYSSGVIYFGSDPHTIPVASQPQQTPSPVVVNDLTFTPAAPSDPALSPVPVTVAKIDGQDVTPIADNSGAIIFHGTTLAQGGAPTTIDAIPIIASAGSIYISGQGIAMPTAATAIQPEVNPLMITAIAGQTVSVINPSAVLVDSQTIIMGQSGITISGQPVTLGSSALIIGTYTIALPAPTTRVVIGSETIALAPSDIVVAGSTLTPGSPGITVSGTYISLGSTVLVVGSKTEIYAPAGKSATAASGGLGALIMSGLGAVGGIPVPSSQADPGSSDSLYGTPFTGDTGRLRFHPGFSIMMFGVLLSLGVVLLTFWL